MHTSWRDLGTVPVFACKNCNQSRQASDIMYSFQSEVQTHDLGNTKQVRYIFLNVILLFCCILD
jgi:hypothetical protein